MKGKMKKSAKTKSINELPGSRPTLVAPLNWSMPVSMANVHYWLLLFAAMWKNYNKNEFNGIFRMEISSFILGELICSPPTMHWFSVNFPVPISRRFEVFRLFSVVWFLYRREVSAHKTLGYLFSVGKYWRKLIVKWLSNDASSCM